MKLTAAQSRALGALDRKVLRQFEDLRRRDDVTFRTLASLLVPHGERPALVQIVDLKPATWLKVPYHRFYVLTEAGIAARKVAA